MKTRVWIGCLVSWAHETWSRSLLFKDFRIFAYSSTRDQSNKTSGTRLKTESETGKRLKWCPRSISRDFVFFVWRTSRDYPPPPPTTIKHTTGVTDNKKYSSHDSHWLSPERGTFFRLQVYQRIKISLIKVSERVGKSLTSVCKKTKKTNRRILWLCKSQENVLVL